MSSGLLVLLVLAHCGATITAITVSSRDGSTSIVLDDETGAILSVGGSSSVLSAAGSSLLSFGDGACVFGETGVESTKDFGAIVTRAAQCAAAGASLLVTDTFSPTSTAVSWKSSFFVWPGAATFTQPLGVALNFSGEAAGTTAVWATWTRGCVANKGCAISRFDGSRAVSCYR
jgi:hypothetical protein